MVAPLPRTRLTEQVTTLMTQLIAEERWPAGTMLPPEADLARHFGVSRTVIRECVRVLASRGMLDVRQGRGTSVLPTADWNVSEPLALLVRADRAELLRWLEVRTILELESAALAALRADDGDRAALLGALERLERDGVDPDLYAGADLHFHLTIGEATKNPPLVRLLRPVVQPLREQLQPAALLPQARRAAAIEHRAIAGRILAGDAPGARAAMAAHLGRVVEEIGQLLRERSDRSRDRDRELAPV